MMLILSGCSGSRYLLTDSGRDKRFLINKIRESSRLGETQKKPIIVLDGKPYRYDFELKNQRLQIARNDIKSIDILKDDVGTRIYGDFAKDGVLIVTTKKGSDNKPRSLDDSKVLIMLEDRVISKSEMEAIDPNDIQAIDIYKDRETVRKYTSEEYDGVVIIHLKKKEQENK